MASVGLFLTQKGEPAERSDAAAPSLSNEKQLHKQVGGNGYKSAKKLEVNIKVMAEKFGLERLGFLTLTFAEHITCPKEAGRRFHSLATNVLNARCLAWVSVFERQKSGRIHFHVLVALRNDIRTGVDWKQFGEGVYRSAGPVLRSEWAFWRNTAHSHGFGRTELLPIRSTEGAIAKYVGKYLGKHMDSRKAEDKGVRLVRYSQTFPRRMFGQMTGVTGIPWLWRQKLRIFAQLLDKESRGLNMAGLSRLLGRGWVLKYRSRIMAVDLWASRVTYPDYFTMCVDDLLMGGSGEFSSDPSDIERESQEKALRLVDRLGGVISGPRFKRLQVVDRDSTGEEPF
jgi:hypothetical protein